MTMLPSQSQRRASSVASVKDLNVALYRSRACREHAPAPRTILRVAATCFHHVERGLTHVRASFMYMETVRCNWGYAKPAVHKTVFTRRGRQTLEFDSAWGRHGNLANRTSRLKNGSLATYGAVLLQSGSPRSRKGTIKRLTSNRQEATS